MSNMFKYENVVPNEDLPFRLFLFEGEEGNYKVEKHWHQSIEIFLVLQGHIDFYINSNYFLLEQGQFILVNSNEIHSIDALEKNKTIVLQIPRKIFEKYATDDVVLFKSTRYEKDTEVIQLIETMFANYKGKHTGYEFKVLGAFYYLISILVTKYLCPEIDEERKKQNKNLEKLSSITHYIKENYQEEISLESVANHFGFTPAYLSRMFQKYANINYKTYLGNIRVDHALKQLINTGDPINTIAISSGFSDSRAFAKAFIKRYQMLPSEYRKMLLSKTEHNKR